MASFTPQEIEQFLQEFFDVVGARQYIGARYVPLFGRRGEQSIEWDNTKPYEPLTIVTYQGDSYTSRQYVPATIDIRNPDYWALTGSYNSQVEQYRMLVMRFQEENEQVIADVRSEMLDLVPFPVEPESRLGTAGQVLSTLANGKTRWVDPLQITPEVAEPIIEGWLDDHPEATTTILDGAVTTPKLADGAVTDAKLANGGTKSVVDGLIGYVADPSAIEQTSASAANCQPQRFEWGFNLSEEAAMVRFKPQVSLDDYPYVVRRYRADDGVIVAGAAYTLVDEFTKAATESFVLFDLGTDEFVTIRATGGYVMKVPKADGVVTTTLPYVDTDNNAFAIDTRNAIAGTFTFYSQRQVDYMRYSLAMLSDFCATTDSLLDLVHAVPQAFPSANVIGVTLESYVTSLSANNVSRTHYPIRVRDEYGNPLGRLTWTIEGQGTDEPARFAVGFDKDGTCIARYSKPQLLQATDGIPDGAYFLSFISYTNLSYDVRARVGAKTTYVVDVAGGGDYTSLTDCFRALRFDEREKVIYVRGGEYDIYEEMGGDDYFENVPAGVTWDSVSVFVPPNTHVIGLGKVRITMSLPASLPDDTKILFSPVNMDRTSTLENVYVTCDNARYCIHIEGSKYPQNDNQVYTLKNVSAYRPPQGSWTSDGVLVCGFNKGSYVEIEDCTLVSDNNHCVSFHDQSTEYDLSPSIHISDTVISGGNRCMILACTPRNNMQTVIDTTIANCYLSSDIYKIVNGMATYPHKDCFKVTLLNTDVDVNAAAGMVDVIPTDKYVMGA